MSGTRAGGLKTVETNKRLHGEDFYARIGAKGGRNGHTGGFAADRDRARIAGAKGGATSKRDEAKKWWDENEDKIEYMMDDGLNSREISQILGVTLQRFYYSKSKYGVKK